MIKPAIAVKQLVSTLAYADELTTAEFISGIASFAKNPAKAVRILNEESTFIRERGSNMERDVKAAVKTDIYKRFAKSQNLVNTLMMNVKIGDKGAILMGSWAMREAGRSITEYEEFGSSTQQSADISRLSQVQRGNSLEKLFTMFKSSQRVYFQKELNAVSSLFKEGGTSKKNLKKVAKTLFIYHVLLPVSFQMIANMGGWSDEDKKEYLRAGLLGSLNGIFIAGDIIDSVLRGALGMKVWDIGVPITNIYREVNKIISNLTEEDIDNEDYLDAVEGLAGAGTSLGLPTEQVLNISKGVADLLEGNAKNGIGQILGWSEYALGGEAEKDKKGEGGLMF